MKINFKSFLAGVLAATTVTAVVPSLAREAAEQITAVYRNIKLVVDGVTVEPKDANGNTVEPFIYNGTTYLPVRAVATAFNKEVSWDGENAIVYLGSQTGKPAKELTLWNRPYIECDDTAHIKTYDKDGIGYIECEAADGGEELSDGRRFRSYSITYPLNSLAKTFSGTYYMPENASNEAEGMLKVYNSDDDVIYQSPIIRGATTPIDFTVNVENELSIKIVFEQRLSYSDGFFYGYFGENYYIKNPVVVSSDY